MGRNKAVAVKRFLSLLLTLACLLLCSCNPRGDYDAQTGGKDASPSAYSERNYMGLGDAEKTAYRTLFQGLGDRASSIRLKLRDQEAFDRVFRAVLYDHPELEAVSHRGTLYQRRAFLSFSPEYLYSEAEAQDRARRLEQKTQEVLAQALEEGMRPFEKELALHDWLVGHCRYDAESLAANNTGDEDIYTAFGALVLGRAVCEGYAKAFLLLMRAADIPCALVTGSARQEGSWESHMWNAVWLDGKGYYVDPTWNAGDGQGAAVNHTYFNITEEQLLRDHTLENGKVAAHWDEENYFVRRGMLFFQYDEQAKARMRQEIEREAVLEIAFTTKDAYRHAMKKLVKEQEIHSLFSTARPGEKRDEIRVSYSDTQLTMQFYTMNS